MRALYVMFVFLFFSSCVSHQKTLESDTQEIIECIRENDFDRFKTYIDERFLLKDEEGIHFYFEEGYKLMKRSSDKQFNYKILKMDDQYFTEVMIPVFSGFDSTNGAIKAAIQLSFRPPTPYSKYSKLQDIYINYEYDEAYRNKLRGM